MAETKKRKIYIDLIRSFSVCLIFLYHFDIVRLGASNPVLYRFANGNWGNIGVFLFFMISGNCLMYKYEYEFEWKDFLKNRISKILVPFWICYILVFLFRFWQTKSFPEIPFYRFGLTIVGMDGYFAYKIENFYLIGEWFLGSILFLYLLFPIMRYCVKKSLPITIGILFALNIILYYNNFFGFFVITPNRNLLTGLFYFVLGIGTETFEKRINKLNNRWRMLVKGFIYGIGIIIICIKLPINEYLISILLTVVIFLFFIDIEKMVKWEAIGRVSQWLSQNSYVIFLMHHVIINSVLDHFAGNVYSFKGRFCVFAICILLLWLVTESIQKLLLMTKKLNFTAEHLTIR